jgi:hypothetical protein
MDIREREQVWLCLGGTQPSLLQDVERQIWNIVWEHATRSIDLRERLREMLARVVEVVSKSESPQDFSWFSERKVYV